MVRLSDKAFSLIFIGTLAIFLVLLVAYPLAESLFLSVHSFDLSGQMQNYIGFTNYAYVFTSAEFYSSLTITLEFAAQMVIFTVLTGMGAALLLHEELRGRGFIRTITLLPWAIPTFMVGTIFTFVYSGTTGTLNGALYSLHLISEYIPFITAQSAVTVVALSYAWHYFPLAAFFFLGALQSIPDDLYKQAKVDGAGPLRRFRLVTMSFLRYPMVVVLILTTVFAFRAFTIIFVLTNGGPGFATHTLSFLIYRDYFRELNFGLGDALSWVLVLVVLGVTTVYFLVLTRLR